MGNKNAMRKFLGAAGKGVATIGFSSGVITAFAATATMPDALLAIDLNREAVVERITASWSKEIPAAQISSFSGKLLSLRADQLLAATLAGSFDGVLEVLSAANDTRLSALNQNRPTITAEIAQQRGIRNSQDLTQLQTLLQSSANLAPSTALEDKPKAVGDPAIDLVYTPIAPCNLMDTRPGVSPVPPEGGPALAAGYGIRVVQVTGRCGIPAGAKAVASLFTVENIPSTGGVVFAGDAGGAGGAVASWSTPANYASGSSLIPLSAAGALQLQSAGATQIKIDVNGYFMPPNRNGDGLRVIQTALVNTPISIGGSSQNSISSTSPGSTVGGGGGVTGAAVASLPPGDTSTFGPNRIVGNASAATIGGGARNLIEQNAAAPNTVFATIGGGYNNRVYSYFGTIAGGASNIAGQSAANTFGATVLGGFGNNVYSSYGTIAGGSSNQAGFFSSVPGGTDNLAVSNYAFAAGRGASTGNDASAAIRYSGTFIWADSNANAASTSPFYASAEDQFAVRARGGVAFRVSSTSSAGAGAGCTLPAGGASGWSCTSDRNLKDGIKSVSPREVLRKVVAMPLSSWQFKGTSRRHMSPMAQDFWHAFGLGEDDRHITASDVSGVALAALQGLNQKLIADSKAKDAKINALERKAGEVMLLRAEIAAMKKKLGI